MSDEKIVDLADWRKENKKELDVNEEFRIFDLKDIHPQCNLQIEFVYRYGWSSAFKPEIICKRKLPPPPPVAAIMESKGINPNSQWQSQIIRRYRVKIRPWHRLRKDPLEAAIIAAASKALKELEKDAFDSLNGVRAKQRKLTKYQRCGIKAKFSLSKTAQEALQEIYGS